MEYKVLAQVKYEILYLLILYNIFLLLQLLFHRFKWIHLSERLAYERAVHKQRLLTEIAQAKREVNFFSYNVDRSKKLRKKQEQGQETSFELSVKQRETDSEIRNKKAEAQVQDRTEFLKSIFG